MLSSDVKLRSDNFFQLNEYEWMNNIHVTGT